MGQCVHIEKDGSRCPHPAEESYLFCRWHIQLQLMEEEDPARRWRRFLFRVAALLILLAFLVPLAIEGYRLLKSMLN